MSAIPLDEAIDGGELVAIIEDPETSAKDQRWDWRPGYPKPRAKVDCILREARGEAIIFVAETVIDDEPRSRGPVVLSVCV